jgi:hypothetical protein
LLSEAAILDRARERERRYCASVLAHSHAESGFADLLLYVEENLLDIRELAAVRGLDFGECADRYIAHVVQTWRDMIGGGDAVAEQLEETLRALLATL